MSAVKPLLGMTAEPADTELMVATFPDILYMRDFGRKDASGRSGALLTPPGEGKWRYLPEPAIMHASGKGNVEDLGPYLDLLFKPTLLSYWHEPMGNIDPVTYRQRGERGAEIIAAHPNGHLVLGWGPVLTRWWLEHGGNPDDYWFDGATMFCADSYNKLSTGYRTPEGMLATIAAVAATYGVPWAVPELGAELIEGDDGTGRGAWLRGCAEWADAEGNCLAIGEWGLGGNRLIGHPIETAVWQELTAAQKGYTMADWRVARGLDKLLAQINDMAPNRNKASDGSIGDAEHRDRPSDHNPDAQGIVRARDFTHDPAAGADMNEISEALRVSRDRRIKYVIFNRRIFSATVSPFMWRPYTGTNPHDHHMHVSTVADNAIADDTSEWEIGANMELSTVVYTAAEGNAAKVPAGPRTVAAILSALDSRTSMLINAGYIRAQVDSLIPRLDAIEAAALDDGNTTVILDDTALVTVREVRDAVTALSVEVAAVPTAQENAAAVIAEIAS